VSADNPVRFIDAFVEELDLGEAGFLGTRPKATGRPGYNPADMLKLYLYGYLNRVRSSRRLEAEATRNLELIWLLRGLRPDFKTIADFRRDNRSAFKAVFRAFVVLCRKLDLVGRELLAVDGTRLKAVSSRTRNFTKAKLDKYIRSADERLETYLAQLDDADRGGQAGTTRRSEALAAKIAKVREQRQVSAAMLEQLKASGENQLSLTDPDARAMAAHPKVGVGYNAQVAVDAKHKLIVEQAVSNQVLDVGLLAQTAQAAKDALGVDQIDAVADRGYDKVEDIEACEKAGIVPHVPRPQRGAAVREGLFRKDEFRYDATSDTYLCPAGQRLEPRYHSTAARSLKKVDYCNREACRACLLRPRCTHNSYRRVSRLENEAVLDRTEARLAARPELLDQRREIVEHPFGTIKHWMDQGTFLMRGLENVRAEFSLTALAYNLRRAINILGVGPLIAAIQGSRPLVLSVTPTRGA